ncbi:MAG: hypothetical protein RIR05_1861, partial [Bacteroidota bacterium]
MKQRLFLSYLIICFFTFLSIHVKSQQILSPQEIEKLDRRVKDQSNNFLKRQLEYMEKNPNSEYEIRD